MKNLDIGIVTFCKKNVARLDGIATNAPLHFPPRLGRRDNRAGAGDEHTCRYRVMPPLTPSPIKFLSLTLAKGIFFTKITFEKKVSLLQSSDLMYLSAN